LEQTGIVKLSLNSNGPTVRGSSLFWRLVGRLVEQAAGDQDDLGRLGDRHLLDRVELAEQR
jgi:hypothetical protein